MHTVMHAGMRTPELHFFLSRRRRHTRCLSDWSSDVCSSDLNTFAALNQAFFSDGAFIFVPPGVEIAEPVQLIFISSAKNSGEMILPRNLVIAGANSKLTVVESYISTGNAAYFTNAVTEILAGDNAAVEHVKLQDEAVDAFHIATDRKRT